MSEEPPNDLAAIAALHDSSRRALYDFIVSKPPTPQESPQCSSRSPINAA